MSPESGPQVQRCWAFGPHGRCELFGGHLQAHQIIQTWTDEEVINPAVNVPLVALPVHDSVLVDLAMPATGKCFVCGCTEPDHLLVGGDGEAMCVPHQCRTFVA